MLSSSDDCGVQFTTTFPTPKKLLLYSKPSLLPIKNLEGIVTCTPGSGASSICATGAVALSACVTGTGYFN